MPVFHQNLVLVKFYTLIFISMPSRTCIIVRKKENMIFQFPLDRHLDLMDIWSKYTF